MENSILKFVILVFIVCINNIFAQVGIGTNVPEASSLLDVNSTEKGFLPPCMTTTERNAIVNPANGLEIFNTSTGCVNVYNTSGWIELCNSASSSPVYGSFYTAQTLTSSTTQQLIPFTQASQANGLSLVNGNNSIKFAKGGYYSVSVSVICEIQGGGTSTNYGIGKIWLARNLVDIPWSARTIGSSSQSFQLELTLHYQVLMNDNDSLQFLFSKTSQLSVFRLKYSPGTVSVTNAEPSVRVNIYQLVNSPVVSNGQIVSSVSSQAQYGNNSVFCGAPTTIVPVTNPTTGKQWMDRNLGATQVATSSTDLTSYGDLYQWGRGNDGHQCRTSATTSTLSSGDTPGNSLFILPVSNPFDWRSTQNDNLWQGVNGINNPCPLGFRIPTETELNAESASWNVSSGVGAFNSPIKLVLAGSRLYTSGSLFNVGQNGRYWTSTIDGTFARNLNFHSMGSAFQSDSRNTGFSVRCIKN